jgi:hypothetical protein
LNFLEDGSINKFPWSFLGVFFICSIVFSALNEVNILHLKNFATWALFLCDPLSILVSNFKLTEEADDLVAIVAFLWLDRNFLAHHAGRLFDELLLKFIYWHIRISW